MLDWVLQSLQPTDQIEEFSTYVEWKTCGKPEVSTQSTCFPHKSAPWRVVFHTNPDVTHRKAAEKPLSSFHIDVPQSAVQPVSGVQPRRVRGEDPIAPRLDHALHLPLKVGVTALCRAIEQGFPNAVDEDEETAETKRFPLASAQPRLLSSLPALPAFMAPPEEEQAIQRGVATHRALCMISLAEIRKHVENPKALYACICREIERLSERGVLTEQETEWADRRMIARWFESDLGRRMLAAQAIQREWSFNLRISEPFPTMVQGVIDLCFVENGAWVLVDFKTDRVSDVQQLLPRYRRQMDYYRQALQAGTALPVKESILFSLRLGQGAEAAQP